MPLTPKYSWSETEQTIDVTVTIPGVSRCSPDIMLAECVLKVNAPPYLLVLDLHGEVDDTQSAAKVDAQGIRFHLHKRKPTAWGKLLYDGPKHDVSKRRDQAIEKAYAAQEEQRKQRAELKKQQEKAAQQRQWDLEKKKRQDIEAAKAAELAAERSSLAQWKGQLQAGSGPADPDTAAACGSGDESDYEEEVEQQQEGAEVEAVMPDHPDYYGRGSWKPARVEEVQPEEQQQEQQPSGSSSAPSASSPAIWQDIPSQQHASPSSSPPSSPRPRSQAPPRRPLSPETAPTDTTTIAEPRVPPRSRAATVPVAFTPTETEHLPAREQREEELRVFKRGAAKGKADDSVDVADRTPAFLKDKGDALYKQGNFSGAANAYSRALELDDSLPALWANRAACHLALCSAEGCVQDCSRALELLQACRDKLAAGQLEQAELPRVRQQVTQVLLRRAAAACELGQLGDAAADYEEALRYDRGNAHLAADLEEVRACMEPADAAVLRQRGDARARAGDHSGAVEAYSLLLQLPTTQVDAAVRQAALANRAACHLQLQQYQLARQDCDTALQQLLQDAGQPASLEGLHEWIAQHASSCSSSLHTTDADSCNDEAGTSGSSGSGCAADHAATSCSSMEWGRVTRLLSRRAAAWGHLKQYESAAGDYKAAAAVSCKMLGDQQQAELLRADMARMQHLSSAQAAQE